VRGVEKLYPDADILKVKNLIHLDKTKGAAEPEYTKA